MMPGGRFHKGRRWRTFQALVHATYPPVCYWCGRTIAHDVYPPRHRLAPSVDYRVPLALGGAELDIDNARPMHYGCNSSKGARPASARPMPTSRRW